MMTGNKSFGDKDSRADDMNHSISEWVSELSDGVKEAKTSEEFTRYLDVMSNFHSYSRNNQLLIALQCKEATKVAGFNTWQEKFNRSVNKGENAIWIWAPSSARTCPSCGKTKSKHNETDCQDNTNYSEWSTEILGFRPVPVFDVSQTEGQPLPKLETEAHGNATKLFEALTAAADAIEVPSVEITPKENWTHGSAKGVSNTNTGNVKVVERKNTADKARTLAHEYAHSMLHASITESENPDEESRSIKELEAEAVAYVVGRHFDIDVSGSSLYIASWTNDNPAKIKDRLNRISSTAKKIINATEKNLRETETQPILA